MAYKKKKGSAIQWVGRVQKSGLIKKKVFATKAEAVAWEADMRRQDWAELEQETPTVTVLQWCNEYLDYSKGRFSTKTFDEKVSSFKRLFKFVKQESPAEKILPAVALKVLTARAKAVSGYAANKDRKNLVAAWGWGAKYLALPKDNPFKAVDKFAEEKTVKYVPPQEDFWAVYEVAEGQDKVFLLTMLHTAARRGEVVRMRWSDVDFKGKKITLWTRKRKGGNLEADTIPMTEILAEALWAHRAQAKGLTVFTRENGQAYKWRQHLMPYLCGQAKVRKFGFHSIRHLSASMLDAAGVPLATIQAILRHQNATTTSRYLHELKGVRADLDGVFGREKGAVPRQTAPSNRPQAVGLGR